MADLAVIDESPQESEDALKTTEKSEMLAIVGDLMRSIGLVQYYPEHSTLEEVARDFNPSWTTAIEMLTQDVYLGAENWGNLFCLRRNKAASSEEVRFRLDSIGEFNMGELCNKFMRGSLVMPVSNSSNSSSAGASRRQLRRSTSPQKSKEGNKSSPKATRTIRPAVVIGSQTLFGTADGTLGVVLGLDNRTAAFFTCLEKAMARVIRPVGDFHHGVFRSCKTERRVHPAHGFVDGDLIETFVDLDQSLMEAVVNEMNRDGGWEIDDVMLRSENDQDMDDEDVSEELTVDDVLSMVEEMSMLH
jgi:DNA damage-binding protein 1